MIIPESRVSITTSNQQQVLRRWRQIACIAFASTTVLLVTTVSAQGSKTGVDPDKWTPEYVQSIAGTLEVDTAAECAKVVPLDYTVRPE